MTRIDGPNIGGADSVLLKLRLFGLRVLACAAIMGLDQASKWLIVTVVMNPPRIIPVTSFFNLVLVFNPGISFGLLGDLGSWAPEILSVVSLGIIGILLVWLWRATQAWDALPLVMIVGGASGNVLDRIRASAVTDFLDFYVGDYHWPAFNLADVAIVMGVGLLGLRSFRHG